MSQAFIDRAPSEVELERFRLILSTYQDGTGMLTTSAGKTLPGWRDFERSFALAFEGYAPENKHLFDVQFQDLKASGVRYGVSCKMRRELNRLDRDGRVTIELSNSAQKYWAHLSSRDMDQSNYKERPLDVGVALIDLVSQWHHEISVQAGAQFDLGKSCYLTLSWNIDGWYQLHQFKFELPNPRELSWYFPTYTRNGVEMIGSHLNGDDDLGTLFEWYGESGGQLKYYPPQETAVWQSERFRLEHLPEDREHGILYKVERYFPELWSPKSGET